MYNKTIVIDGAIADIYKDIEALKLQTEPFRLQLRCTGGAITYIDPCIEILSTISVPFEIYIPSCIYSAGLEIVCKLPKRIEIRVGISSEGLVHKISNEWVDNNKKFWRYWRLPKSEKILLKHRLNMYNLINTKDIELFNSLGRVGQKCAKVLEKNKEIYIFGSDLQEMLDCRK